MKWQTAAEKVLQTLTISRWLGQREADDVRGLIDKRLPVEAFSAAFSILARQGWRAGWNKFWQGSDLLCWYGNLVLCQPIRHVAHEIENIAFQWEAARERLNFLTLTWRSSKPVTPSRIPLNIVFNVDNLTAVFDWASMGLPELSRIRLPLMYCLPTADTPLLIEARLGCYGLAPSSLRQERDYLRLLQRLNLDVRERPYVEKWRWTNDCGAAQLSDEGRFQIKPALVWARSIEEALIRWGGLSETVTAFLRGVDCEGQEAPLPEDQSDPGLDTVLKGLYLAGFIERHYDGVRFAAAPGGFPALALRLWADEGGQSLQEDI